MQNITVKVCYKGKTLIVGKGINSIGDITKELVKRFPEVEQIKSSLAVQYENAALDLQEAYRLAEKENKKFIKVKFVSGQLNDKSFVSDRAEDSSVVSVLDSCSQKDLLGYFSKPKMQVKQISQISESQSEVFQHLDQRFDIVPQISIAQNQFKKPVPSSNQEISIEPVNSQKSQEAKGQHSIFSNKCRIDNVLEILKEPGSREKQVDNSLFGKNFSTGEQKEEFLEKKQSKRQVFEGLFGFKNQQKQKENSLNPDIMSIIQIVRKEFETKIQTLQAQYDDLRIKYNDLNSKYDNLSILYGANEVAKVQQKPDNKQKSPQKKFIEKEQIDPAKLGYQEIKNKDSKIQSQQNLPVDYSAEIQEFSTIQFAHFGDHVQSSFRFKNNGTKKWPENMYVQEQNSDQLLDMKSLGPNQSKIVTLHIIKAEKIGQKISKTYQLAYFDEKNNLRKFGRVFGISVEVIQENKVDPIFSNQMHASKKPIQKIQQKAQKYIKKDPEIQFREYINQIMPKSRLFCKNLYDVIKSLKDYGINPNNYKDLDTVTLNELIRSISQ